MQQPTVMTVTGPLAPGSMGLTLHHEHVMSTFGAELARYPDYDVEKLFAGVTPYLQTLKSLGVQTLVDCTAAYFGRHPEILRKFSTISGLNILTNTGYYGAADDRYVPPHAFVESADKIAERWTREWKDSIDETGVFPGFIKTAVDAGPISAIDAKLISAAARTHLQTGLTIQTHVGDNWEATQAILSILQDEGVDPTAWIWIHAHNIQDASRVIAVAERGAWISFDGLGPGSAVHILELVQAMKARQLLQFVLLSHDGDSYMNGESRPYHFLMTDFMPLMKTSGLSDGEIHQLVVDNPARAYKVHVRSD